MERGARRASLNILIRLDTKEGFADELLKEVFDTTSFSVIDRAFITELVYGVLRQRNLLDWIIEKASKRQIKKSSALIRNILRLGAYQLLFLDKVPVSAAVNESVKLAKEKERWSSGFVNAVLRNIDRERERIPYPEPEEHPIEFISVRYSHPAWLVKRWIEKYGFDKTIELCRLNNDAPPFTIRANRLKIKRKELKELLKKDIDSIEDCSVSSNGLILKGVSNISENPAFKEGLFYVQDEAAQMISHILDPKPSENILDACAAPGGKTTDIAELMGNKGNVIALDVSKKGIGLLKENCERLGINIVKPYLKDAAKDISDITKDKFDKILIDAPCSGLGIIRRHPEGKWQKKEELIFESQKIQKTIIENLSKYLKSGGVLVYSTCSTENEENEDVVEGFLNNHPAFKVDDIKQYLPETGRMLVDEKGFLHTSPLDYKIDGFFAARLRKIV
ncbi:MAG: 16S rRNA (cytosine(967)-C(5))-methyltransferase RsmB [Nitrospirae bacterium]|nr:16S rRNA (cytosine(967)-C(5))-methyltransferase RsmB [Nitrospirota bacterium]